MNKISVIITWLVLLLMFITLACGSPDPWDNVLHQSFACTPSYDHFDGRAQWDCFDEYNHQFDCKIKAKRID